MTHLAPSGWGLVPVLALGALCLVLALLLWHQGRLLKQRAQALRDRAAEVDAARREAAASNAAKNAFLAQMSHEIRTPFQGLMGMLALLQRSGLSVRQAEQLGVATESAEHLLAILNDVLDLSLLESGRLILKPGPVALRPLLRQVEALMRPQAGVKALALHVDAEPAVPDWCIADATRVKQVLLNLLSNAIKFSTRGSVALDLRLHPGPPERLVFLVTDTGVGMDAETAARLFQRPPAGPSASVHPDSGAGLGLEISRRLARTMGGDISVHSVASEGSRFRFELPLQRHQPAATPAIGAVAPPDLATAGTGRSLKVLVAEDHPVNRQYLASLLETLHHQAFFVADGRAAVQAVQQQAFDLVLMDLHMPELDGTGATLAIRALPDRAAATVPIVALTADAFQETRERCLLVGMNDFLTKPVSPEVLAAALRRLYGQEAAVNDPLPDTPPLASAPLVPPAPDVGLIDHTALAAVLQGMRTDRLSALITQYLDEGPQTVAALRTAVRDGEPLALRAHAHAACGAALNLGLAALAQTAQLLHEGAAHLPAHEIAHLVQRYEQLLARTRRAALEQGLITR